MLRLGLSDDAARDDGDRRNPDMRGEEIGCAVVDDVEPTIAVKLGEEPLYVQWSPFGRKRPSRVPPGETKT